MLGAKGRSYLKHVLFEGLSVPLPDEGGLTASVTFHESDVTIENCLFRQNREGDDFLNIIRSNFEILNSSFQNTFADALDIDFCTGRIASSTWASPI